MSVAILQIGGRIRAERARRGISLRSLARSVGLSPSLISQIETGKCRPSVSTLYAITTALGVSVEDVFGEPGAADGKVTVGEPVADQPVADQPVADQSVADQPVADQTVAAAEAARAAVAAGAASAGAGFPGAPVVRPGEREVLELDSGVTWERLGHVPGSHVDFLRVSYAPGGSSSGADRLMRHVGTEYGYLVEGELVVMLGFRTHRLLPGDSISFASSTPHSYRNEGPGPAVGIWFVAEPD